MQVFSKQEKRFSHTENNLTDVRIVAVSMLKIPNLEHIQRKSNNSVQKCISTAWDKEALALCYRNRPRDDR